MTDNDIRAGVVARNQHSVRRDDARSWIRACRTARLRAGPFDRAPLDDGDTRFDRPTD
ncbi:MAG: hypothetical protein QOJ56_5311 [Mycobacterium sp.]|jgi:hypothetical protein|nr:hypothetical protein [Mycobacterium sp.]MDT5356779.1 hypothetical protein [Mycobacterium sp.]MDT7768405.1 hypothetical protein [Mycobacterium sp.]